MIWALINLVFAVVFWSACTVAIDEDRVGWAWFYLIVSAGNGAAVFASIF